MVKYGKTNNFASRVIIGQLLSSSFKFRVMMLLRFPCKNDVRFIFASILVVGAHGLFKLFIFIWYLQTLLGVNREYHIICSYRLTLIRRIPLIVQELPTIPEHPSSHPWDLVEFVLLRIWFYSVWCFVHHYISKRIDNIRSKKTIIAKYLSINYDSVLSHNIPYFINRYI